MAALPIGLREYGRVVHSCLILQGHELHWITFLRGDDLLSKKPADERYFFANVQG